MNEEFFKNNKYSRTYYKIIDRAKNRVLLCYTEDHHIIPKCLDKTKKETVALTAKEHYLCHLLLIKMVKDKVKMRSISFALARFRQSNSKIGKRITGAAYEVLKRNGIYSGENNAFYGKGYLVTGDKNHFYGKTHTNESKEKMRKSQKKIGHTGEKNRFYGKKHTDETKRIISEKAKKRLDGKKLKVGYRLISPDNNEYIITERLRGFCLDHNLNPASISTSARKGQKTAGWKVYYYHEN